MKDLDFDELDKAVNSLMTDASKTQPDTSPAEPKEEKTLDITPTLSSDMPPSFEKLNEATAKTAGPVKPTAPLQKTEKTPERTSANMPPAARRGGRFMDVVHPSADMKKPDVPARVSRQGVTISPTNTPPKTEPKPEPKPSFPDVPSQSSPVKPDEPEPEKPTPLAVPSRPPVEAHTSAKSDWPDPLEMAGFKDEEGKDEPTAGASAPAKNTMAKTGEAPDAKPSEVAPFESDTLGEMGKSNPSDTESSETSEKETSQPLTSPFLSDAKVEKRPLGGATPAEAEEPSRAPVLGAASEEKKSVDDPAAQLPASPEAVEPELPEELQSDLVAIEADTSTHAQAVPATSTAEEKKDEPAKPAADPGGDSVPNTSLTNRDQEEKLLTAGPTSIPQQYREEESTGDKASGAIYDTNTYHQPLAHPDKKRSGWLVVAWIIAILLLGAGGGAALYLSGIV